MPTVCHPERSRGIAISLRPAAVSRRRFAPLDMTEGRFAALELT